MRNAAGSNQKTQWQVGFQSAEKNPSGVGSEGLEEGKVVSPMLPLIQMFYFNNYFSNSFVITFLSPLW